MWPDSCWSNRMRPITSIIAKNSRSTSTKWHPKIAYHSESNHTKIIPCPCLLFSLMKQLYLLILLKYETFGRIPTMPFLGRRNRIRDGNTANIKDKRGVSWSYAHDVFRVSVSKGIRHGGGALQRHALCTPAGGECWRMHGAWQWSPLWYLLPHSQAHQPSLYVTFTTFVSARLLLLSVIDALSLHLNFTDQNSNHLLNEVLIKTAV